MKWSFLSYILFTRLIMALLLINCLWVMEGGEASSAAEKGRERHKKIPHLTQASVKSFNNVTSYRLDARGHRV